VQSGACAPARRAQAETPAPPLEPPLQQAGLGCDGRYRHVRNQRTVQAPQKQSKTRQSKDIIVAREAMVMVRRSEFKTLEMQAAQTDLTARAACRPRHRRPPTAPSPCRTWRQQQAVEPWIFRGATSFHESGLPNPRSREALPGKAMVYAAAATLQLGRKAAAAEHRLVGVQRRVVGTSPLRQGRTDVGTQSEHHQPRQAAGAQGQRCTLLRVWHTPRKQQHGKCCHT